MAKFKKISPIQNLEKKLIEATSYNPLNLLVSKLSINSDTQIFELIIRN